MEHLGLLIATVLALGAGMLGVALNRRRIERRGRQDLEVAKERNLHEPASLHPVINPDQCIGSLSCISVCPEGDILGVIEGRAHLIRGANCIGHGRCALECPVDAIRLVFGTSVRGVDLPEVDERFESSRPGVHIVGELGGMGLIRNAVRQGLELAGYLAEMRGPLARGMVDVAIVGSGPAGIATALGLQEAGVSFRILDQNSLGGTIACYPRHKIVLTEPLDVPFYGRLTRSVMSKEDLLEAIQKSISNAKFKVYEGVQVMSLDGQDGDFTVMTNKGPLRARKVVLACGRRGTPRKLGVPGEQLSKVTYRLIDAEQYEDCKVLVVGGGDSALEAAISLAEESNAEVTLSYRNAELGRCREANRQKFNELVQSGRIRALMPSQVTQVTEKDVALKAGEKTETLANDYIIVNIGGELPLEFLNKMGVGVKRVFGDEPGKSSASPKSGSKQEKEEKFRRRLAFGLFALGAAIVAFLAFKGGSYYLAEPKARLKLAEHASLKSAGLWGHGVGVVATLFMLSNFLYSVRKRFRVLKGTAPIRTWLTFHMFVGFMSPLVILFHAAFQSKNMVAAYTFASLLVVVVTGIVGRFLFGLVPSENGKALEHAEIRGQMERLRSQVMPMLPVGQTGTAVRTLFERVTAPPTGRGLIGAVLAFPLERIGIWFNLLRARNLFDEHDHYAAFKTSVERLAKLRLQVDFYRSFKRLMGVWRLFHAVLAIFLVLMIAGHIGLSWFLGYHWIF